jgi:hypothetical protein
VRRLLGVSLSSLIACSLAACSQSEPLPPAYFAPRPPATIADESAAACNVTFDRVISYRVPQGTFSPIDVAGAGQCPLGITGYPPIPSWARPSGPTHAIFIATSLQETYSLQGMQLLEQAAASDHVPMTWMIGNPQYLDNGALYIQYHLANGDDVEAEDSDALIAAMKQEFPFYHDVVSVQGAGHERDISSLLARGESGFWGITWDSRGIDHTADMGAPWGTYCADPTSYKRPQPDGGCTLLAFEWTARDLTRAYESGLDYFYSTDPDDLQERGGFNVETGSKYIRSIVDAYAAAGQTTPLVMMSQEESFEVTNPGDIEIMSALYAQAVADGMKTETLAQADVDARAFSANPRAVAFPYIAGGTGYLYPATIDFHDTQIGMSFLAGHTLPSRAFRYADDPISVYDRPLALLPRSQYPTLESAAVSAGSIVLQLNAPVALHFGVAFWSDPSQLGITGPNVFPAGHGGVVVTFDLQPGPNDITIACSGCKSATLPYAGQ